ncbi:DUF6124 family protein [Pseudomonas nunensis]|uniref:DUF6124 family protein n=1 Tax=Pseudomonas nunensis TaxID=2961896 RepID=A0ABY5E927_9PSED|nr:DUF6124 family protein [Pseudomonas nunensis]KPN91599.1 hypothetical protein AL066_15130 [Pseudomonas nunensis]MCL5229709.1 DUF6124 family protein [Pseudomonas nunensis]UTO11804.1 DUF6124 family protein [Pseudomonas nunensis]
MFKVTPNPPHANPVPYDASLDLDPKKLKEAADRALNFYLSPGATKTQIPPHCPSNDTFIINPAANDETLLVQACESLGSATEIASEIASTMDGAQRRRMLVLQQVIRLGELAVNRVLDNHKPG